MPLFGKHKEAPPGQADMFPETKTGKVKKEVKRRTPNVLYEEATALLRLQQDAKYEEPKVGESLDGTIVDPSHPPEDDDRPIQVLPSGTTIPSTVPANVKGLAYLIEHGRLHKKKAEMKPVEKKPIEKKSATKGRKRRFRARHVEDSVFPLSGESYDPADLKKMADIAHQALNKTRGT